MKRKARRWLFIGLGLGCVFLVLAIPTVFDLRPIFQASKSETSEMRAHEIRNAASRWRAVGNKGCPTIDQLVSAKELPPDSVRDDAWGSPYQIGCTDDNVDVRSPGPDKQLGTVDDVFVPRMMRMRESEP